MSFAVEWLNLREAADNAARDAHLRDRAAALIGSQPDPLIVDLGAGTGSTMRALGHPHARWRLIDNDRDLLQEAARRGGERVETVEMDLTRVEDLPLNGATLVTASALFDLVGAPWIDALADRLATERIGIYAALSYDGNLGWAPPDRADQEISQAFNRDQRSDKGFGPALGPDGAAYLTDAMRKRGYAVHEAQSPWQLGSDDAALHRALLEGIADAAAQSGAPDAGEWLSRKFAALERTRCVVGHVDVLALPG